MHQGTIYFCMEEATLLSKKKWQRGPPGPLQVQVSGAGSCKKKKSAIIESNVQIYSTYVNNCSMIFVAGCPKFRHLQCIQSLFFYDFFLLVLSLSFLLFLRNQWQLILVKLISLLSFSSCGGPSS